MVCSPPYARPKEKKNSRLVLTVAVQSYEIAEDLEDDFDLEEDDEDDEEDEEEDSRPHKKTKV